MPALLRRTPVRWLLAVVLATLISAFALIRGGAPAGASGERPAASPPPRFVVSVSPNHGPVGGTFQATLTMTGATCDPVIVGFYLNGAVGQGLELAPMVTMSPSCQATATIMTPSSWTTGPHRIVGTYLVPVVPRHEQQATFNVDTAPAAGPTSTAAPTAQPSLGATSAAPSGTSSAPATTTTSPAGVPSGSVTPSQSSKTSAPPSVQALGEPSARPSSPLATPVAADIDSTPRQPAEALLWVATIGIIAVGLFGSWVVRKQRRAASPSGRGGGRDSTGRHRF